MKTYIAINEDVFGGYGLIAVGLTQDQAKRNAYREYRKVSAKWNDAGIGCKTLAEFEDNWGFNVHCLDPDDKTNNADALCG